MTYYKIIRDGEIIGAGCNFMKWFPRTRRFAICDMQIAECVHDTVSETLYHADWLKNVPQEATMRPAEAIVTIIDAAEYDEIIEQLVDGETIPIDPEPEPEPTPEPEPEPEPEHRMTVQEMREKIEELTAMVMTEAKSFAAERTYQSGEILTDGSKVYIANHVIVQGETVTPGLNCTETSIAAVLNALQQA